MFIFGMSYEPTPSERALAASAKVALRRMGLLVKQAAFLIGAADRYLDDALSGRRPLKLSRLMEIEGFRRAWLDVLADEEDCEVIDRRLIRAEQVKRRMVKASLPALDEEDVA